MTRAQRPFPPGRYPLVIVGSGPGALQASYFLKRHRISHAVLSADRGPGGMFRRFPFFDRLISWSKPYPPTDAGSLAYDRFDWNSLLSENPRQRGLVRREMDKTSYFPRRSEMERGLTRFAELTSLKVRYRCAWESTRKEGEDFVLTTSNGEYRAPLVVFGVGVTQPWLPNIPGVEHATHYVDLLKPKDYAGKRVFIIGKRNSGFETAHGLLPWASRIVMASPSPVTFSIHSRHASAARAIYMQPYEDHVLGGGHYVLDGVPSGIEPTAGAYRVHLEGTTVPGKWTFEVDEIIGATGFKTPLRDLPALGVTCFGHQNFPALTPFWESAIVPNIFFVGSATLGAPGLTKFGRSSSSGVVHGFRHNARVLADHIAQRFFEKPPVRSPVPRNQVPGYIARAANDDGALWNQQAYLTRVLETDGSGKVFDVGLQPLTHFLDRGGPDAMALTIETDGDGDIHPTIYVRHRNKISEHVLGLGPLQDCQTKENARDVRALIKSLG